MRNEKDLAAEYRKHAKALRAAAAFEEDATTSAMLKKIANKFEDTADEIAGADGANKSAVDPYRTSFAINKLDDGAASE